MKTRTSIKAGIDTVPLPERPFVGIKDSSEHRHLAHPGAADQALSW